jgi:hypothetical protein
MAATTKKAAGAGFRHCRIYALDSNGLGVVPAGDADTAYDGLHFDMAKALTPTIPDPTVLAHTGDDKVGQIDLLPPTEAVSFEMRTGHTNFEGGQAMELDSPAQGGGLCQGCRLRGRRCGREQLQCPTACCFPVSVADRFRLHLRGLPNDATPEGHRRIPATYRLLGR